MVVIRPRDEDSRDVASQVEVDGEVDESHIEGPWSTERAPQKPEMCKQEDGHALHGHTVPELTPFYLLELLLLPLTEEVIKLMTEHPDEIVAPSVECFEGSVCKVARIAHSKLRIVVFLLI